MTKARGRLQREKRVKSIDGAPEVKEQVEAQELEVEEWEDVSQLTDEDRLVQRWVHDERGNLVDFCLEHQHLYRDTYVKVIRVDSSDYEVHVHRFDRRGKEVNRVRICGTEDMELGSREAEHIIWDGMGENLRRWLSGT